ncbi:MAG TPA: calcium-binding protein [Thermoleophilaceae bacterium]|jgi:Ca2+-binding RTX toxin-like protein
MRETGTIGRTIAGVLAVAAGAAVLPATAAAGTASSVYHCSDASCLRQYSSARYRAEPGERNDVLVTATADGFRIEDRGAPVQVQAPCSQDGPNAALCPGGRYELELGDGDDAALGPASAESVRAGAGDDTVEAGGVLLGEAGNDRVTGSAGPDSLYGGGGVDTLSGGAGDDRLDDSDFRSSPPDDDMLVGGPGIDAVSYERTAAIVVDLPAETGGQAGEHDRVIGVESVVSNFGPSRLVGTAAANELLSGLGPSEVLAGAGDDRIQAEYGGRQVVRAGSGDDVILMGSDADKGPEGADDVLSCGPGRDSVGFPGPALLVPPDCERADGFDADADATARLATRMRSLTRPFARVSAGECEARRCVNVYGVRAADRRGHARGPWLAHAVQRVGSGRVAGQARLRLTDAGRRLLADRGKVRARLGFVRRGRIREGFSIRLVAPG